MATQENIKSLTNLAQVEANRSGQITTEQKARLTQGPRLRPGLIVLTLIAIVSPTYLICGLVLKSGGAPFLIIVSWLVIVGAIVGLAHFRHLQRKSRIKQDLANNIIKTAEGYLDFGLSIDGWTYRIRIPGRRVSIERDRGGLLPGVAYRFYYLPHTGFILSAEQLAPPNEAVVRENLLKILAWANRFSLNSLAANRQGRLAAWQIIKGLPALLPGLLLFLAAGIEGFRVYQSQWVSYAEPAMRPTVVFVEGFIFAMIMPVFLVPAGIWAIRKGIKSFKVKGQEQPRFAWLFLGGGSFSLAGYLIFRLYRQFMTYPEPSMRPSQELDSGIFVTIACLLLVVVGGWLMSGTVAELWQRRVLSREGVGRAYSITTSNTSTDEHGQTKTRTSTTYYYFVSKQSFKVSKRAYNALIDRRRYRLYYLPHSRTLVNIEPVSARPASKVKGRVDGQEKAKDDAG